MDDSLLRLYNVSTFVYYNCLQSYPRHLRGPSTSKDLLRRDLRPPSRSDNPLGTDDVGPLDLPGSLVTSRTSHSKVRLIFRRKVEPDSSSTPCLRPGSPFHDLVSSGSGRPPERGPWTPYTVGAPVPGPTTHVWNRREDQQDFDCPSPNCSLRSREQH